MKRRGLLATLALLSPLPGAAGCDWDFERMQVQPHFRSYEPTEYFKEGTIMQEAPAGTVAYYPEAAALAEPSPAQSAVAFCADHPRRPRSRPAAARP